MLTPDPVSPPRRGLLPQLSRSGLLALVSMIVVTGFAAAVAYHYQHGVVRGRPYPLNTFLFLPADRFMDFWNIYAVSATPVEYAEKIWFFSYFPFAIFLIDVFTVLPRKPALICFLLIFVLGFVQACWRHLADGGKLETLRNVLFIGLFSYPFIFTIDRANNEGYVFLFLYWFALLVHQQRYGLSVWPLAAAVAMKPFPLVFLPLLVARKRYWEVVAVGLLALLFNGVSAGIMQQQSGYDFRKLPAAWQYYNEHYVVDGQGLSFGHSLWGPVCVFLQRYGAWWFPGHDAPALIAAACKPFFYFGLLASAAIAAYIVWWEKTFWKQLALMVCMMNLFPFISADYKLLHVFIPLLFFFSNPRPQKTDVVYAVLMALLLIPRNYHLLAIPNQPDARTAILYTPLLMVLLMALIIGEGLFLRRQLPCDPTTGPSLA